MSTYDYNDIATWPAYGDPPCTCGGWRRSGRHGYCNEYLDPCADCNRYAPCVYCDEEDARATLPNGRCRECNIEYICSGGKDRVELVRA